MRQIVQEKLYFTFRDTDGVLSFSLNAYEGEPENPRFLFDGKSQVFFMRRAGQVISLADLQEEVESDLKEVSRVRILETPEDSSEILRQYDVQIVLIEPIVVSNHHLTEKEITALLPKIA